MQKVKKSKQKISAVLLSIIMAFSLIIVPSAKKVYASGDSVDNFTKWTLAQVLANDNSGTYFNDGEKPDLKTAIIYEAKKQDQGSTMYFGDFYSSLTDDFKENIFTEEEVKDTLKTMDASEYGGAPLIGLNRLVVKTHGSAKAIEIKHGIFQCVQFKQQKINEKIAERILEDQE